MSAILRRICELVVHSKLDTEQFKNLHKKIDYMILPTGLKSLDLVLLLWVRIT